MGMGTLHAYSAPQPRDSCLCYGWGTCATTVGGLQAAPLTFYCLGLLTHWAWSPLFFRLKRLASEGVLPSYRCCPVLRNIWVMP
jgi:hypothetical protein